MAADKNKMLPQLKVFKTTDLSPLIRMAGAMMPRMLDGFLKSLDEKQKGAIDKIMPVGGEKKIYLQLMETPTPPIVIKMAQPLKMSTLPEDKVKEQKIKGIKITIDDIQLLAFGLTLGTMLRLVWRLKGQIFTILGLMGMFIPIFRLGPSSLQDMKNKLTTKFKPLFDMLPKPK